MRLFERPGVLWSPELLEHSQVVAAAGDPGLVAGVGSLAPGHHQHPRQCLAHQEVPLGAQG